jgi:hypothetical protein
MNATHSQPLITGAARVVSSAATGSQQRLLLTCAPQTTTAMDYAACSLTVAQPANQAAHSCTNCTSWQRGKAAQSSSHPTPRGSESPLPPCLPPSRPACPSSSAVNLQLPLTVPQSSIHPRLLVSQHPFQPAPIPHPWHALPGPTCT